MTRTNVTPVQAEQGLLFGLGVKWTGSTITYSIPGPGASWIGGYGDGEPVNAQYSTFSAAQGTQYGLALSLWDDVIAPNFQLIADSGDAAQMRVAFTDVSGLTGSPSTTGFGYSPPSGSTTPENGDVWIDESLISDPFATGGSTFELLLHEIGHALGLKHPFDAPTLPAGYDFKTYTVMSYSTEDYFYTWSGGGGSISYSVRATIQATPMVLDILALQRLYGADTTTRTGNTTYTFSDTTPTRQAIHDAGGVDTFDLSALSRGSHVDLRPGACSDIAYYAVSQQIADLTAQYGQGFQAFITSTLNDPNRPAYEWERNVGIAFSTVIENVIGSGQADDILGNDAGNRIDGGGGADTMSGGKGSDVYIVDNIGDRVFEANAIGVDTVFSSVSFDLGVQHIENLTLTGGATIDGTGNSLANVLDGNAASNRLDGRGGADTLFGRGGDDVFVVDNAGDVVVEVAGQGSNDRVFTSVSHTLQPGAEVEFLATNNAGSTVALDLTGSVVSQYIIGNDGINRIDGKGGADTMEGRGGNDIYIVDNAGDVIRDGVGQGTGDQVVTTISYQLAPTAQIEFLRTTNGAGLLPIDLTGNNFAQTIIGNDGANRIDGRAGADTMEGRGGNDRYVVDEAGDVIIEGGGQGTGDIVATGVSYTLGAAAQIETLQTTGSTLTVALTLTGNGFAQTIIGNAGANVLDGKGGNDTLRGLGGSDTFAFTTQLGANNVDAVLDYSVSDDTIRLENAIFVGLTAGGTLLSTQFAIGAAALDASDRIIYNAANGFLLFDADGTGQSAAQHFATLSAGLAMTASEFAIV